MLYAEDMESTKCHLGGVIVRDLSIKVSNYRAHMTLDEYLKEQKVRQNVLAPPGGVRGGGVVWRAAALVCGAAFNHRFLNPTLCCSC